MIDRLPAKVPTRSRAVSDGTHVFAVGVAPDKVDSVYEQTKQALARIDGALTELGSDKSQILTVVVYIADMSQKEAMNKAWDEWADRNNPPMRMCIGAVLESRDLVEILATAKK